MNLLKGSLQDELDAFFKHVNNQDYEKRVVSKAALCKARQNLSHSTFIELNKHLIENFYDQLDYKKWKGFRLNAIDGSTLQLPRNKDMHEHFGAQTGKSVPQARLSSRYDILNEICIDLIVEPICADERAMAHRHVEETGHDDLLLYDRGYPCFSLFSAHRTYQSQFVMRLAKKFSKETTAFEQSESLDEVIVLPARRPETKRRCQNHGVSAEAIKVRLIKVPLDNGDMEILATSLLDAERYPREDFKSLYALRWAVEEDYKTKKVWLEFENFSGKSVESVYQDVYAKRFVQNIAALIAWQAKPIVETKYHHRKHDYKINKARAISKLKNCFFRLTTDHAPIVIQSLIEIFVITVEPIRPNRSFKRRPKCRQRLFYPQYKTVR